MELSTFQGMIHGFGVALQPNHLMWCFVGVFVGNMVGVLPGLGVMATISVLLPLTFGMDPVSSILMLGGIYYGAQYGGAICAILLNLPTHPPHAVTCLDGYQLTQQGRGGAALGVTMISSFVGASFGIVMMMFFAPLLVAMALKFGDAEICALMLVGLIAGSTLVRGSPIKGIAMTCLGLLIGLVGSDANTGLPRFAFDIPELQNGIDVVALALGLFGIGEFLRNTVAANPIDTRYTNVRMSDMKPTRKELKRSIVPMLRGTVVGSLCSLIPGTGPTIASFVSYAIEKKFSKNRAMFGRGAIEGVAAPEAATHSATQGDFIPTMSLGIPGDAVMALLLSALIVQGIQPGPTLIIDHPDIFWGLIASFWIGNILLVVLNVPMIGIWVKMLKIPYRFLMPGAVVLICIGAFTSENAIFDVWEAAIIGLLGYGLLTLGFRPAPIILGFILGPRMEEHFRRALLLSHGNGWTFFERPISAFFFLVAALLILVQIAFAFRNRGSPAHAIGLA